MTDEEDWEANEVREFYKAKIADLTAERDFFQKEYSFFHYHYFRVLKMLEGSPKIPEHAEKKND